MSDADKPSKLNPLQKTMRRFSGQSPKTDVSPSRGGEKHPTEIEALQGQVKGLEEELYQVRRRLEQVPREFELLRARLQQSREQLEQA
ncbi:MAG: proteasome ATPase, partial [candidate division NC10 bacterium]